MSFKIPASSYIRLIYTTTVPSSAGAYTNTAYAQVGNEVIGPTQAVVHVGQADLAIFKNGAFALVQAGQMQTYTLGLVNNGPDVAENVVVTEACRVH